MVDLTLWKYLFDHGTSLKVYGYGSLRLVIDARTGLRVISYVV